MDNIENKEAEAQASEGNEALATQPTQETQPELTQEQVGVINEALNKPAPVEINKPQFVGGKTFERKEKKKFNGRRLAELEAQVADHSMALNISATAHQNQAFAFQSLLECLDLEIVKTENGTVKIAKKSKIQVVSPGTIKI